MMSLVHLLHPGCVLSVTLKRWHVGVISDNITSVGSIILLVNAEPELDHPVDPLGVHSRVLQAEAGAE